MACQTEWSAIESVDMFAFIVFTLYKTFFFVNINIHIIFRLKVSTNCQTETNQNVQGYELNDMGLLGVCDIRYRQ